MIKERDGAGVRHRELEHVCMKGSALLTTHSTWGYGIHGPWHAVVAICTVLFLHTATP